MKSTFNVLFFVKKDKQKINGSYPIFVRITVDGVASRFNSKVDVQPKIWDGKAGKAAGRSAEATRINRLLDDINASLNTIYHELQRRDNYVTAEKVKNEFLGHSENHDTILNLFQKHNDDVKQLVGISKTIATYRKYEVTRRHLAEFIQSKYNLSDISIKEITPMFITDFELYLRTTCKCGYNTTAKFMQFFKRIILIARNNGILIGDPFANYKILKKILSISIWMMLQHGLVFGSWFVFFITMEHFGERSLAITNIVRNISSFLFLFVQAFASVVSSLVGNLIGENKGNSILYVCKKVIFLCYMTILPIMVLFLFFPSSALRIYSDNTVLVFEAIPTLKVMLTSYLIAVPTFVFFSAVSGIGHAVASLLIAFISLVVYIVYVETISHFSSSVPLLWTSEHIYFSCVFILSLYHIHHSWMSFINQDKKLTTNIS